MTGCDTHTRSVGESVGVGLGVGVGAGVGVAVGVAVGRGVGVGRGVEVGRGVAVAVGVGVAVGMGVGVAVGVGAAVAVGVGVGVAVGAGVDVAVAVGTGVDVAAGMGVAVGTGVAVGVGVGAEQATTSRTSSTDVRRSTGTSFSARFAVLGLTEHGSAYPLADIQWLVVGLSARQGVPIGRAEPDDLITKRNADVEAGYSRRVSSPEPVTSLGQAAGMILITS